MKKATKIICLVLALFVFGLMAVGSETDDKKADKNTAASTEAQEKAEKKKDKESDPEKEEKKAGFSYEITDTVFFTEKDSLGETNYYGIVEVTNTGDTNAYLDDCVFDFEDDNGHLLQTDNTMISSCPDIIAPGEKGYFYNSLGGTINSEISTDNGLNFKPTETVVEATGDPVDYEVSDLSIVDDMFGPKITGRVKNTTDKDDSMLYIQAVFYDNKNRPLAIMGTNVLDLGAGQQKSFDITGLMLPESVKSGNYDHYVVMARASYYQF